MLELYSWSTPNGQKAHVMLAELELDYHLHPVDLGAGRQRSADFLRLNANGKIPVLVDPEGPGHAPLVLAESGAILLYLAERSGRLLPQDPARRWQAVQWLMFQMSGVGPVMGQLSHFAFSAPQPEPYALERFLTEAERQFEVLERRLGEHEYLADEYSIADIACYPWVARHQRLGLAVDELPALRRWLDAVGSRPAVRAGMDRLA